MHFFCVTKYINLILDLRYFTQMPKRQPYISKDAFRGILITLTIPVIIAQEYIGQADHLNLGLGDSQHDHT